MACNQASKKMCQTPKVSVIVPVFEVEPYLNECLDSIAAQSIYDCLEVILVLKPGSDRSCDMAEKYAQTHGWPIIYAQQDDMPGDSRNLALDVARGEYVAFADSDDVVSPTAYEEMLTAIENNQADVAIGRAVHSKSNSIHARKFAFERGLRRFFSKETVVRWRDCPELVYSPTPWNKMIRLAHLRKHNVRFLPKRFYEDMAFVMSLLSTDPLIVSVPKVIYMWRKRHGNPEECVKKSITQSIGETVNLEDRIFGHILIDNMLSTLSDTELTKEQRDIWEKKKLRDLWGHVRLYSSGSGSYRERIEQMIPPRIANVDPRLYGGLPFFAKKAFRWLQKGQHSRLLWLGRYYEFQRNTLKRFNKLFGILLLDP